jgi:hypothetical protein
MKMMNFGPRSFCISRLFLRCCRPIDEPDENFSIGIPECIFLGLDEDELDIVEF